MERMKVKYVIDGKDYVTLPAYEILEEKYNQLEEENKNLKEKVETLELWLDNKEKLNEEYRDKIDLLKYQSYGPSELADSLYDANKTIEKLKAELSRWEQGKYRYFGNDGEQDLYED